MNLRKLVGQIYKNLPLVRELAQIRDCLYKIEQSAAGIRNVQALRILDFDLPQCPRFDDGKRLLKYAFQVCSQNGEDGMIWEAFRRIGTTNRHFVEIGAGDGSENNTAFLLSQGWNGVWIDANEDLLPNVRSRRDLDNGCIRVLKRKVTRENVAGLMEEAGTPHEFDLLSIDIDQNTYHVWQALVGYHPRVVIIEYNADIPPDIDWKSRYAPDRVWDGTVNYGASLKALELLGRSRGYDLVGCDFTGANAIFVRSDATADLFLAPFTAENHFEPSRYPLMFRRGRRGSVLDREC